MLDFTQLFPTAAIRIFLEVFLYFIIFSALLKCKTNKIFPLLTMFGGSYAIISIITLADEYPGGFTKIIICICIFVSLLIFYDEKPIKKILYFALTFAIENFLFFIAAGLEYIFFRDLYIQSENLPLNQNYISDFLLIYIVPIILAIPLSGLLQSVIKQKKSTNITRKTLKLILLPLSHLSFLFVLAYLANQFFYTGVLNSSDNYTFEVLIGIFIGLSLLADWYILIAAEETESTFEKNSNLEKEVNQYKVEYTYIKNLEESNNELEKIRHDTINQNSVILLLIQNGKYEQAMDSLKNISHSIEAAKRKNYCRNSLINSILQLETDKCYANGVQLDVLTNIDTELNIEASDICSLLLNLIDNSIEAAKSSNNKNIKIEILSSKGNLLIHLENPYKNNNGTAFFKTSKPNKKKHGFGIQIAKDIAKKLNGNINYSFENGTVTTDAVIPLL